jgi:hypothetical protein
VSFSSQTFFSIFSTGVTSRVGCKRELGFDGYFELRLVETLEHLTKCFGKL